MKPFDYGPDRNLVLDIKSDGIAALGRTGSAINYGWDDQPEILDGCIIYHDAGRVLVAFDEPLFEKPCWLPEKYIHWVMFDPASDFGIATIEMPAWIRDSLDLFSTRALLDRRREEAALREAEKEAERKRQQRDQRRRMGLAAVAAKTKAVQPNLFEFRKEGDG